MAQSTRLGNLIKSLPGYAPGKVVPGWGTTPVMAGLGVMLLIFMLTILQIYNKSLLIQGINVDWTGLG